MRERLIKFIEEQHISAAKIAEEIGVQRSSISHILSGRNNPSFDFIQKMLTKYKILNAEWLILGTGKMLKSIKQGNLFESNSKESDISNLTNNSTEKLNSRDDNINEIEESIENDNSKRIANRIIKSENVVIDKIITIYNDKTFDIYLPVK